VGSPTKLQTERHGREDGVEAASGTTELAASQKRLLVRMKSKLKWRRTTFVQLTVVDACMQQTYGFAILRLPAPLLA